MRKIYLHSTSKLVYLLLKKVLVYKDVYINPKIDMKTVERIAKKLKSLGCNISLDREKRILSSYENKPTYEVIKHFKD